MWVDELKGTWNGQPALIIVGGPSLEFYRESDFRCFRKIGLNYVCRLWRTDMTLVVKDYIYADVKGIVDSSSLVVPKCAVEPQEYERHIIWEPASNISSIWDESEINALYSSIDGGGTTVGIHLAHVLGANPILLLGVDLKIYRDGKYHAEGYWHTDKFFPGGARQTPADVEVVFERQLSTLKRIQSELAIRGTGLYFISYDHWRTQSER